MTTDIQTQITQTLTRLGYSELKKGLMFTDIHWGKKNNSVEHNQDCMNLIELIVQHVKSNPDVDYIAFLGDWHENRSSLNLVTLKMSFNGAKLLNDLNIPIFFIIGNHDLYHRHTRDVHSVHHLETLENFILIEEPTIVSQIKDKVVFSPYLFEDEYANLEEYKSIPVWMGHFEFKGFVVTGYNIVMPTGPDKNDFKGPEYIFSGHFHKRQNQKNIHYIGNAFPMDFSDAFDDERGFAVYDHTTKKVTYHDWKECPKYRKLKLSNIIDNPNITIASNSRVICTVDVDMDYKESQTLAEQLTKRFNLREFTLDETIDLAAAGDVVDDSSIDEHASLDDFVIEMLRTINVDKIDNELLVSCYMGLDHES